MNDYNELDTNELEQLLIGTAAHTDASTFKMFGSDTAKPAGQVLKGAVFSTMLDNALSNNTVNVGTVDDYSTATEEGDGNFHKTTLSLTGALPAIAGGADLAVGRKIYTFPAGVIRVHTVFLNGVAITQSEGNITADTPDVGIGTTIASGAVATLDGTAAFENLLTGQTFTDCDGTAERVGVPTPLANAVITAAADHTIYLNVADGWAASGDAAATISGDVVITWEFLS